MAELVIKRAQPNQYELLIRDNGPVETDYSFVSVITKGIAASLLYHDLAYFSGKGDPRYSDKAEALAELLNIPYEKAERIIEENG